jgi:integrase
MGSIRKRGDRWRAEVRRRGSYKSAEFRTKAGAQAWVIETEADILAGGLAPSRQTLEAALQRYSEEVSPKKRGARWEQVRLAKMAREMECRGIMVMDLRPADFAAWRDARLQKVSAASVNREWNLLRSVLSTARREWGWLKVNPMADVDRPPATRPRTRRVSAADCDAIARCAGVVSGLIPSNHIQRVALAFELAVESGMRAGELRTLEPDQIDLARGVCTLILTKNGDSREVPLSVRACELLRLLQRDSGPSLPMTAGVMDSTFRRLRKKAGLLDLHFHDSRAEAATRISRKVDVLTLARILGHRDVKSLMTYYRESAEDIAKRLG